jgi:hypothetical protein
MLYKGVIFSNYQPKGQVLKTFLDTFHLKPKTIIFFDDIVENLVSVAHACKERNIACTLYHYTAQPTLLPGTWNTWNALKQIDYLVKHHQWLSDQHITAAP